jgi:hypothetical protein
MQKFPEEKLEKLLAEEKWDEVKTELKNWLGSETGPEQQAENLLLAAQVYARIRIKLSDDYLKEVKGLTEILNNIGKESQEIDDLEKTEKIQNRIKKL